MMQLRICEHAVVVVSSAEAAREIFQGHDAAFEQRASSPGIDDVYAGHNKMGVLFSPYGEHWRLLRRVLVTELLSARRVQAFRRLRQEEAARLVSSVVSTPPGQLVNVDKALAEFVAESAVRAIFGDMLPDRAAFLRMMRHGTAISSLFDLRDLFPSSRLVRMLPRSQRMRWHRQEVTRLIDDILRHHEERKKAEDAEGEQEQEHDMIDVLLRIQNDSCTRLSLTPGVINSLAMVWKASPSSPFEDLVAVGAILRSPTPFEYVGSLSPFEALVVREAVRGPARPVICLSRSACSIPSRCAITRRPPFSPRAALLLVA
ncbi:hypothetical protein EJB05_03273, partial [Eragrostis curvula]